MADEDDGAPNRDWRSTPVFNFGFAVFTLLVGTSTVVTSDWGGRWIQAVFTVVAVVYFAWEGIRALRRKRAGLQDLP